MSRAKVAGGSELVEAGASRSAVWRGSEVAIVAFVLAFPTFASAEPPQADAYTFTAERLTATLGALAALIAAIVGGVSLARAAAGRRERGRRGAVVALVLGLVGLIVGLFIVMTADGGLGTGNGVGGGYVAIALSLVGMTFSVLTLRRSRRTA